MRSDNEAGELTRALILRAALESTTDAILITGESGNIIDFNEQYSGMWGVPRDTFPNATTDLLEEFASRNFADPEGFLARRAEITPDTGDSFDVLETSDGRIIERFSRVLSVEGRLAGRVWSFRDVTERHLGEITARRLAAIVSSSDDAIIGKDLNSIITSWNLGAERIFGYTEDEMIGESVMRLIPPERQNEEQEILARLRRGERFDHFETIRVTKDGRLLNVSITVSPIKDSTGHVIGASKVLRDITDKKIAEEALKKAKDEAETANTERQFLLESERDARSHAERANRVKDEFLATLGHELRTPLNAVLGWTKILGLGNLKDEEIRQGLEVIERNARAQARIIDDMLDMSGIMSGKVRLNIQLINAATILGEAVESVRAGAEAREVTIKTRIDNSIGEVRGDPDRLRQIFWNLLTNAIKFTPKKGTVRILLERLGSHLKISITDTGEGIAPEFLPYIFERFRQADASTTRRHGGIGLGLAIVRQLAELHGGSVSVQSEGVGLGSTFIVRLPVSIAWPESSAGSLLARPSLTEPREEPEVSLQNMHILVVDDEPDAREVLKRLLAAAGATVSAAASAPEAMDLLRCSQPDVMVCDIGMPGEDGYTFIRKLRGLEEWQSRSLPAIALTAYAKSEDRTKAIQSGFQNHLAKPVEAAELLAVISSLGRRGSGTRPNSR